MVWLFWPQFFALIYNISLSGIYFAEHSSKSNQYIYGIGGGTGCPAHKDRSCYSCQRWAFYGFYQSLHSGGFFKFCWGGGPIFRPYYPTPYYLRSYYPRRSSHPQYLITHNLQHSQHYLLLCIPTCLLLGEFLVRLLKYKGNFSISVCGNVLDRKRWPIGINFGLEEVSYL